MEPNISRLVIWQLNLLTSNSFNWNTAHIALTNKLEKKLILQMSSFLFWILYEIVVDFKMLDDIFQSIYMLKWDFLAILFH